MLDDLHPYDRGLALETTSHEGTASVMRAQSPDPAPWISRNQLAVATFKSIRYWSNSHTRDGCDDGTQPNRLARWHGGMFTTLTPPQTGDFQAREIPISGYLHPTPLRHCHCH